MADDVELDDLDRKILNKLMEEGRKSFRKISEDVDSTPATVINRVERLEEEGAIEGYGAKLDYGRLGYDGMAAVEVVVKGDDLDLLKEQVEEEDSVVSAYTITGDTDLLLLVKFEGREELRGFVQEELTGSEHVEKTITHMTLDVLKENQQPPL
ncbi:MAG: Lrp/AsnC family transcriptional regulator [Candidatus Nanohaloarchaea archaeon]|nr:Lrp/AsnC family transcriptional regulator [Candidatus Nanohaloarchaea archaeon]